MGLRDAYYTMRMGIDADRVAGKRARGGLLLGRAPGCVDAVAPTRYSLPELEIRHGTFGHTSVLLHHFPRIFHVQAPTSRGSRAW